MGASAVIRGTGPSLTVITAIVTAVGRGGAVSLGPDPMGGGGEGRRKTPAVGATGRFGARDVAKRPGRSAGANP